MKGKVAANPKAHFRGFNFHPKVAKADGEELWKPELGWKTGKLEMEEKETIVSNFFIFSSNSCWKARTDWNPYNERSAVLYFVKIYVS